MAEVPVIQVLEKKNYFSQALVPLPDALPLPPLESSSMRIRTEVMCLTVNNFTYALLGHVIGWWDVHPVPSYTPAPYNDDSKYGRMNCWGLAKVTDSTFDGVPAGSYVFGYLPIGTLPLDLQVKAGDVSGQVIVTTPYRQKQMAVYNRYSVLPASLSAEIERKADTVAYDALFRVMHKTSYLMSEYVFSADPRETIHPAMDASEPWGPGNADLTDATVIVFAPGSKVALAFARELRRNRAGAKPRRVVGAASAFSRDFVQGTGLYDEVVLTSEEPTDVLSHLDTDAKSRIAVFDFGGRAGVAMKWATAIKPVYGNIQFVGVGFEVWDPSKGEAPVGGPAPDFSVIRVNADDMARRAMQKVGVEEFWKGLDSSFEEFRKGGIKGFRVNWGEGMADVKEGWDRLARGEVTSDEGLVFKL